MEIGVLSNHAQVHDVTAWRGCGRKSPILPGHFCQNQTHSKHSLSASQSLAVIHVVVCFSSSSFIGGQYGMEDKVIFLFSSSTATYFLLSNIYLHPTTFVSGLLDYITIPS